MSSLKCASPSSEKVAGGRSAGVGKPREFGGFLLPVQGCTSPTLARGWALGFPAPQWALRDLCLQHLPHTGSSMSFMVFPCAPQWALGFLSSSGGPGVFLCASWGALGHLCSGCWNTSNWGLSLSLSLWFWTRGSGVLGLCVAQGCPPLNPSVLSQWHSGSGTPQAAPCCWGGWDSPQLCNRNPLSPAQHPHIPQESLSSSIQEICGAGEPQTRGEEV